MSNKITRVEVISKEGRVFIDWLKNDNFYEISIQDDGRTIKLFETSGTDSNNNSLVRKNNHGFDHPSKSPKIGGLTNG